MDSHVRKIQASRSYRFHDRKEKNRNRCPASGCSGGFTFLVSHGRSGRGGETLAERREPQENCGNTGPRCLLTILTSTACSEQNDSRSNMSALCCFDTSMCCNIQYGHTAWRSEWCSIKPSDNLQTFSLRSAHSSWRFSPKKQTVSVIKHWPKTHEHQHYTVLFCQIS